MDFKFFKKFGFKKLGGLFSSAIPSGLNEIFKGIWTSHRYCVLLFPLAGLITIVFFQNCSQHSQIVGGFGGSAQPSSSGPCPTGPLTCTDLTWNASTTQGVSYHIWQGTSPGNYTVEYSAGQNLYYQVSGLSPGTYYFAATAYNSNGESTKSNETSATIALLRDIKKKEEFVAERVVTIPDARKAIGALTK